jgi:hypothetical protein
MQFATRVSTSGAVEGLLLFSSAHTASADHSLATSSNLSFMDTLEARTARSLASLASPRKSSPTSTSEPPERSYLHASNMKRAALLRRVGGINDWQSPRGDPARMLRSQRCGGCVDAHGAHAAGRARAEQSAYLCRTLKTIRSDLLVWRRCCRNWSYWAKPLAGTWRLMFVWRRARRPP